MQICSKFKITCHTSVFWFPPTKFNEILFPILTPSNEISRLSSKKINFANDKKNELITLWSRVSGYIKIFVPLYFVHS